MQRGGFASERDAAEALERALEQLRRQKGVGSTLTLKQLVEEYLAQYDAEPETIDELSWLLAKALRAFGGLDVGGFDVRVAVEELDCVLACVAGEVAVRGRTASCIRAARDRARWASSASATGPNSPGRLAQPP